MIGEAVINAMKSIIPEDKILLGEPMSAHTTMKVGGRADCMAEPQTQEQLRKIFLYLREVGLPFFILGNGSNTIVRDEGVRGVVIHVGNNYSGARVMGDVIVAKAGTALAKVAALAYENGLTGMEFAAGIPGTVGGAVIMNAGAYGGEMKDIVTQVTAISPEGEILNLENSSMGFRYRASNLKNRPFVVSEVTFRLKQGDKGEIRARMEELAKRRREKQPMEYPSAGSTFKRPEGHYAGELIMNAGMRGFRIGGAMVSEKHCGFVINAGDATAEDVLKVIDAVKERVKDHSGVDLEPEVVII